MLPFGRTLLDVEASTFDTLKEEPGQLRKCALCSSLHYFEPSESVVITHPIVQISLSAS
jgi:hypothetical protein